MVNKYGNLTDILIYSLARMKANGISRVTFNIDDETISIKDPNGELTISSKIYANHNEIDNEIDEFFAHYNNTNIEGPHFDAIYTQKKAFKEISSTAISVGKDLHILLSIFSRLPSNPPMRNKVIFSRKEIYRKALLEQLKNKEFKSFKGTLDVTSSSNQINLNTLESDTRVSIKIQEGANFKDNFKEVASKLAENIYESTNMEINEQINKELSRRRELRLHVKLFKAYVRLQAFCASNLVRGQSETIKSQAKAIVVKYFPQILLPNMNLMLQRAPRIYRLLMISNEDWRFLDSFEELSTSFFKSSMNSSANFEIWLNLVKTGKMASYEEGSIMREKGKMEMREAHLNIITSYFDEVNENLEDLISDDYD